jgi:hypothetical protein
VSQWSGLEVSKNATVRNWGCHFVITLRLRWVVGDSLQSLWLMDVGHPNAIWDGGVDAWDLSIPVSPFLCLIGEWVRSRFWLVKDFG